MAHKASVIVPLYIYPFPGAWKPLHQAVVNHPNLQFSVIVNPHNGPGAGDLPDNLYKREIRKLNSYANVCTLGYVRIDYCRRPLSDALNDIKKYAQWSSDFEKSGLGVSGIFVDETPNIYETDMDEYLNSIDQTVKHEGGIRGDRLVIHNPGTVPEPDFANPGPDVTAIFEAGYVDYHTPVVQERISNLLSYERSQCAYLVHSVPAEETKRLVVELRERAQYLFITDLQENFYVQFGRSWQEFIAAMQTD